ncbi:T9SS type A sorting domain-containing protein [Olleya sp. Bg11-27]|uniref:T9SS type A sorting domain-containing protein n=1 Tax=Olleya sp. Bg11-27 TaxID=2058135 RepID=UPI000C31AAEE|nr:T9SS type A sorting domain-containing protein [Olleya sp. Bg11-27]AUC76149.1 hypothetical protein CW732_10930 [Olleya sp. Bg11-27]
MKKIIITLTILLPFLSLSQDKVIALTINQPNAALSISGTATPTTGFGLATGSININVSGGTSGYTYAWSNGVTTQDISGLSAGFYSVVVTDANSCTETFSGTVTQPAILSVNITNPNGISCNTGSNGGLLAVASGGISSYSFQWAKFISGSYLNIGVGPTLNSQSAGLYRVIVTDGNNITAQDTFTLDDPPQLVVNFTQINVECFGAQTGSIDLTITGGTGDYTVDWLDLVGDSNPVDRTSVLAGTYAYSISDASGCTVDNYSTPISITQPIAPLVITPVTDGIQNPTFSGATDGSIDINVTGGSSGYTYSWSNGVTTQDLTGLSNGTYILTVTDAEGCMDTETFILTDPLPFSVSINTTQTIGCNNEKGTLQASAAGGVPNPNPNPDLFYNYAWFNITSGTPVSIGITTATASNLIAGDYRVIATDYNGNTSSADQSLTEPTALIFSASSSSNTLCFGGNDGSASVSVSGGTGSYTYVWTKTGDTSYSASTSSISTLTSGEYNLAVTDANACTINTSFIITQPASEMAISLVNQTNVLINGQSTGAIDINVFGGTPSYTYTWSKTGDVSFSETTQDLININAGEYIVVVKDSNSSSLSNGGCIATQTFIVTETAALNVSAVISNYLNCFGDTDGQLTASISGGIGPFSYSWFKIIATIPTDLGQSTNIINGLSAGDYQVQVTDTYGAVDTVTITISNPIKLIASLASTTNVSCFEGTNGSIDIDVSGGTGSYTYSWSDLNGALDNSTQDLVGLTAGSYNVSIHDDNSCSVSLMSILIAQPVIGVSVSSSPIITDASGSSLTNGSVEVAVTGGTGPYTYLWTDALNTTLPSTTNVLSNVGAGSYFLTVTDFNGCILSPIEYVVGVLLVSISNPVNNIACFGGTGTLIASVSGGIGSYTYNWYNVFDSTTPLSTTNTLTTIAGEYTLEVTDGNGIVNSQNILLNEPPELVVTFTQTNVLCNGGDTGSIDLSVTGGTGSYTYNWSNTATTQDISDLISGTYSVTVRDSNLCPKTVSVTITQAANPLSISLNPVITDTSGYGLTNGSVEVTVAGGTSPYTYLWTDALNTTLPSTTNVLSNVGAGSYFLTVIDNNGCVLSPIEYVVGVLLVSISNPVNNIACFGDTGILIASVSGGTEPYIYNWYNVLDNTISLSATNTLTAIAGEYILDVIDYNGTVNSQHIILSDPDKLLIDTTAIITSNVNCYNGLDGSIQISVSGGTGLYTYVWNNNGSTTNSQNELSAGIYSVTVTDASGCSVSSGPINITQPEEFLISSALLVRPNDTSSSDGSISIDITGGIAPFDYEWFDASDHSIQLTTNVTTTSNSINNLNEGLYTIVVTDSTGCIISTVYNLANPGELLLSANLTQDISCFGSSNAILDVTTIGGAGGNNFAWYNAIDNSQIGSTQTLNNVPPGSYYVIVSNADGLQEQSAIIVVTGPEAIAVSLSQTNPVCFGNNDGSITITATGGNGVYEYNYQINGGGYSTNWFTFDTANSSQITMLGSGNYDIRVRDSTHCFYEESGAVGTLTTILTQPNELLIDYAIENNPTGFGLVNGSIDVTASGGTLAYTYLWSDSNGVLPETTNILSNLGAGDYTVLITDVEGCLVEQSYTLTQPQDLSVTIQNVNVNLCNGDNSASLIPVVVGGVVPYSYQWFEVGDTSVIGDSELLENLSAGNYYVVITDNNSNTVQSTPFIVLEPDLLDITLSSDFVLCGDGNDWEITSIITGGTEPYTYSWNNGALESSLFNVSADTYILTVTDSNGCLLTENISLVPPPALSVSETLLNPICFGASDGFIQTIVNGGALPYTYLWDNGETTANISNLNAGSYELTITDFKGCELIQTFTLTDPTELILDLGEDITLCANQTYLIDAGVPNGVSYQWTSDNGFYSENQAVELSLEGVYIVTAVNNIGCIATDEIIVTTSNQAISAQFLVSSQVFVDESFFIIDDSNPIPDDVIWVLPEEAEILSENNIYAEIRFNTAGEYEITMISIIGDCSESQTKSILVIEQEEFTEDESNQLGPIITEFIVYPNPSDGNFNVNVDLRETLPISLKIFGLVNNSMLDYRTFEGESSYQINYALNVPSGVYFIILETAFATQLQKIVIE